MWWFSTFRWQFKWSINLLQQLPSYPQSWGKRSHQKTITQDADRGQRLPKGSASLLWEDIGQRHRLEEQLFIRHTRIFLSCWFSSLVALQSINQQTTSFPNHPSSRPCSCPVRWWVCACNLLQPNAPPTPRLFQTRGKVFKLHEPNGHRTAQLGGPIGPWMWLPLEKHSICACHSMTS